MEKHYPISEASRLVDVESHVLRYWEEELSLKVNRYEMGHRYYTEKDIETLKTIKELKKEGYGLKAIRSVVSDEPEDTPAKDAPKETQKTSLKKAKKPESISVEAVKVDYFRDMLADVINQSLKHNNLELKRDIGRTVSDNVIKEINYLSRIKEEQDEARYKQLDETIRVYQRGRAEAAAAKEKKPHRLFLRRKKKGS